MDADADTARPDLRGRVTLGRTGLQVSRLGIGASYGVGADAIEKAYSEYGINYLYWGSVRRESFGEGIRRLASRYRDDLVVVIQSYTRIASLLRPSLEGALRRLQLDQADILLLGFFNRPPAKRILDAAQELKAAGRARFLAVSCHHRPTFRQYIEEGVFDVVMFRYSAAHRKVEHEVFPDLQRPDRPGAVAYTATRWGTLINPRKIPADEQSPRAGDCYRFVLSHAQVDVCLTGPRNAEQLGEGLAALDRGPMNEEELAWMRRVGDHIYRSSWRWGS